MDRWRIELLCSQKRCRVDVWSVVLNFVVYRPEQDHSIWNPLTWNFQWLEPMQMFNEKNLPIAENWNEERNFFIFHGNRIREKLSISFFWFGNCHVKSIKIAIFAADCPGFDSVRTLFRIWNRRGILRWASSVLLDQNRHCRIDMVRFQILLPTCGSIRSGQDINDSLSMVIDSRMNF